MIQTCECVLPGHPDKVCDLISDYLLAGCLSTAQNPRSVRVACEVMAAHNLVVVGGEVSGADADVHSAIELALAETDLSGKWRYAITNSIHEQSLDIAGGVGCSREARTFDGSVPLDNYDALGAGDQGIVYGAAFRPIPGVDTNYLPFAHWAASALARELWKSRVTLGIGPDGKVQITSCSSQTHPHIDTIIISVQHEDDINLATLGSNILRFVAQPTLGDFTSHATRYLFNPSGRFVNGGPEADCGVTGRKLQVDTYGGIVPHGGGALSGKDPTKVDRSGAYYARYAAKNIVAAGLAEELVVQVAYAIGCARPISIAYTSKGASAGNELRISHVLRCSGLFDFRPAHIIDELSLPYVHYPKYTNFGHFTDPSAPWERLDKVDEILKHTDDRQARGVEGASKP